jgi:PAS domain S-box-containing protein
VITTDAEGKITLLNKAAEGLTGWTQAEAAGRPLDAVFQLLDENTRNRFDNPSDRVLKTDAVFSRGTPAVLVSRQGRERVVMTSGAPIHDPAGGIVGVSLVCRDITENRKLEVELHKASRLESLGLLAGGIAHDFNNILTGIFGNVSLAKMIATEGVVQERLDKAEEACLRAKEMTSQLLTFAKGGAPIKRLRAVPQLLKASCDLAVLGSNVRCEFFFSPGLWPVEVDPGQITQVFNNLVLNAVQAMPEGGTITVRAENVPPGAKPGLPSPGSHYVKVSIQDQGPGIPPEHQSRIFDPFFTTKHKGRGLGLATAYSVVRKHEGLIEVESKLEQGTTFHVYLPTSAQALPTDSQQQGKWLTGQGRVLVMDDEPDILSFSHVVLKRLGYEAELARDGVEAIRRYREAAEAGKPFSAVIMDLTIPGGMGGKEAIKRLLEFDPQARAIVSSGYSNDPVMAEFQKHGFRGVVAKPYQIHELARVLREVTAGDERPTAGLTA